MKRDMELVRRILLEVEARPEFPGGRLRLDGYDGKVISNHVELLYEKGYIDAHKTNDEDGWAWMPKRLKWEGHDLLDAFRDESIWKKTKQSLLAVGGAATIEITKAIAVRWAKEKLGLPD